jgi:hypothetical protein
MFAFVWRYRSNEAGPVFSTILAALSTWIRVPFQAAILRGSDIAGMDLVGGQDAADWVLSPGIVEGRPFFDTGLRL